MALGYPSPEDQRKIHAEITQIVNQRLQLTTFAITLFGVVVAWLIPKGPTTEQGPQIGTFICVATILLTTLLFALYYFSHILRGMLRIFTTYLLVTDASKWERDWERYRALGYQGYTKTQTHIFLILVAFSTAIPWVLISIYGFQVKPPALLKWNLGIGVVWFGWICALGRFKTFDQERHAREKWEKLQMPGLLVIGLGTYFKKLRPGIEQNFHVEQLIDDRPLDRVDLAPAERMKFHQLSVGYVTPLVAPSVDCIMLLTPPGVHVRQLEQLADTAKAVLVEKPIATSAIEVRRLRAVAERHPRIYCSDHYTDVCAAPLLSWLFPARQCPLRSQVHVLEGKRDLWSSGPAGFGELTRVEATILEKSDFEGRSWLADPSQGGVVLDLMYHCFTLCAHIFDQHLTIAKASLKVRLCNGDLVAWKPDLGGETYSEIEGFLGNIPFGCKVAKYWHGEEVRSFVLYYSAGTASMIFEEPNTLVLESGGSRCVAVLEGAQYEHVSACFADYVRFQKASPHGLDQALWAVDASDRVKQFALSS